jgi:hypothetical protein
VLTRACSQFFDQARTFSARVAKKPGFAPGFTTAPRVVLDAQRTL